MSALAANGPHAAIEANEEVQRLRLLVRKLEHQNNLLRARSLGSGLSDCGVAAVGPAGDADYEGPNLNGPPRLLSHTRPEAWREKGLTLDDVTVLDIENDSLDEDDSWLYVSPSKALPNGHGFHKNGVDEDADALWPTVDGTPPQSPHVWLRQDLDNPSPEVRMVRKSLTFTLEDLMHAPVNQASTSSMYSRGGSGMAHSAADLSSSGRMSPAIKPALLISGAASMDAGTFVKARRNIQASAGSTPDVAALTALSPSHPTGGYDITSPAYGGSLSVSGKLNGLFATSSPHLSAAFVEPPASAPLPADSGRWAVSAGKVSIPGGLGIAGNTDRSVPDANSSIMSSHGYPSPINTGTFTRKRASKVNDSASDASSDLTSNHTQLPQETVVTAQRHAVNGTAATSTAALLSRSCDNVSAGHLLGWRGLSVSAAAAGTDASKPSMLRASCEALDQIQAMARMQEQSLREDVNSLRRNSLSSGSTSRLMSHGSSPQIAASAPPSASISVGSPAFFRSTAPKESAHAALSPAGSRSVVDRPSDWGAVVAGRSAAQNPAATPRSSIGAGYQLHQMRSNNCSAQLESTVPTRRDVVQQRGTAGNYPQSQHHPHLQPALPNAEQSSRRSLPLAPRQAVVQPSSVVRSSRGLSPLSTSHQSVSAQQTRQSARPQALASTTSRAASSTSNRYCSPPRTTAAHRTTAVLATAKKTSNSTSRASTQPAPGRRSRDNYF